ncbi:DUF4384 domain-containing protein [Desulfofustis limnaeus]|jgi:hypothetical protein|uniref:DUF4384 domain-containing protein n=1 Tax=Desulfofustis limnaeus TaxID=2740163 RepID=A0ABN6MCE3_9BACT|nr:DUF4384 domain-containing protein [Desulfofustis limnaeus]MDX9895454.1 DUF4384 domain-containing protein [Desulfofustis sp.]BDD88752.1 hypothetical protein DPPLL_31170 [Desulfofustis limnaeus]
MGLFYKVLLCLLLSCLSGPLVGVAGANAVEFRWMILADPGTGMQALDFSERPVVYSGTPMQFYLEHLDNCYVYLYLLDGGNQLATLFPMASGYYNYGFPRGQKFYPPGDRTFTFVPPGGLETFFVIATEERPFQLEKLTDELLKNQGSREQQQLLLAEIEKMISDREIPSRKAEDLVEIKRRVSADETITFQAVEVDAGTFYGRRLEIDHR